MGLSLDACDVHIHYRSVDRISPEEHAEAVQLLSPDELERARRFVFARDRVAFVAAHTLLRHALSEYQDVPPRAWTFGVNSYGKPMVAERHQPTSLTFNLSHTDGLVACVIGRGRDVGVDVESLDGERDWLQIASRFFSPKEASSIHGSVDPDAHVRFVELWTLKEAYIKAIGTGVSHPLHTFAFLYEGTSSLRFEPAERGEALAWQFALFAPTPRHRMAVAVHRPDRDTLRITTWGTPPDRATATPLRTSA